MEKQAKIIRSRKAAAHGPGQGTEHGTEGNVKVLVLLSAWNGAAFLREQLDSIRGQKGVEVHLLVRDDGSTDGTPEILRAYVGLYARQNLQQEPCRQPGQAHGCPSVFFYTGTNKGPAGSFNDLLLRPELDQYDYFAFCDQDDVWDQDKLLTAVEALRALCAEHAEAGGPELPAVYCSNLLLTDERLHTLRPMRKPVRRYTAHMALVQNIGTGCTQVFNRRALALYRKGIGRRMEMHDYWLTLVCMFLGRVIYDETPHIRYRQHEGNVVGGKDKQVGAALAHLGKKPEKRTAMLQDFLRTYRLDVEDEAVIRALAGYRRSIWRRLKLAFSRKYRGMDPRVTLGFKIRLLLGRMY